MTNLNWDDLDIEASWAKEPLYYEAPHPDCCEPRRYQFAGVEYSIARDNSLVGDAPGLGKTPEAVMISNAINARRNVVVCPASLRLNWEREVWRWSTIPNVSTYPVASSRDGVSLEANYVILSYDLLRNDGLFRALMSARWDHLILDEAHYLKDPKGNRRTERVCGRYDWAEREYHQGLADVCGRVTMLSGTITPNQPSEVYNAARLLCWDAIDGASLEDFMDTYYEEGEGFVTVWDPVAKKRKAKWSEHVRNQPVNLDDLRWRLRKHLMVRRLKEHVLTELPQKQWHVFPLETTAAVRKVMRSEAWRKVEHLYDLDPEDFCDELPIDGAVSTAYRELGEATAKDVAAYVLELRREGAHKVVVAAWHRSVLAELRERLKACGVVYMDGNTSLTNRQAAVDAFQEDEEVGVILGQMGPLGEGWTLTAAQDVVIAEPWWGPGKNDQCLDRVHRFGQAGDYVIGHVPFVPQSLHERIIARVVRKDKTIHQTLDG